MLFSDFNYVNGQEEGLQRAWFPNGEVQANYVAKNNRKYGITGVKNCQTTFSE
jgi:antitoxin component YwqK of YwqJK toxin-antitoxin module